MPEAMKISIVGTGYVGLVSGACLAEAGHNVTCVDIDPDRVATINDGRSPVWEPGLGELLIRHRGSRLHATTNLAEAVHATDVSFITVGTPFDGQTIDLSQVRACTEAIGRVLAEKQQFHLVVVKSTVVPGTTETEVKPGLERASGKLAGVDFGLAMNPEFLREGVAIRDFLAPDRIAIGVLDDRSRALMERVYATFLGAELVITTPRTAEMIKYAANSLLATLISFSNEIANLSSAIGGIDINEVMRGLHLDHRISPILADGNRLTPGLVNYLMAGPGFGGSCFPKDLKALIAHGRTFGYEPRLLAEVMNVNEAQPLRVRALLEKHLSHLEGRRLALLGVAFKPDTDDTRESPSLKLARALLPTGCLLQVFDPVARLPGDLASHSRVAVAPTLEAAVSGAEAVLVMTCWESFKVLPRLLAEVTPPPVVIDARRMFGRDMFPRYDGIGL